MKPLFSAHVTLSIALVSVLLFLSSCSGSGEGYIEPSSNLENPAVADPINAAPIASDAPSENTTQVSFDIQVPAYQSDNLKVLITWGQKSLMADWVGDESWSSMGDLPVDTENFLIVTFSDDNGDTTLGSYEVSFKTGSESAEVVKITADQFDTDRWDTDADGVSNIDELVGVVETTTTPRVLLFSETKGYRHDSIETALSTLKDIATTAGIETDSVGDSEGVFNDTNLAKYDAVVWALTSGDVLDEKEQAAFERYIQNGGGYVGIHAASDTEYDWPWYGSLVGAYFERHPEIQSASQKVENTMHASTKHLDRTWVRTDEWFDYSVNPRSKVNVLLSLDESTYTGGGMGIDHPSAWYHAYDGGRSWYTGGGHTAESYAEEDFKAHLLGGLRYAIARD